MESLEQIVVHGIIVSAIFEGKLKHKVNMAFHFFSFN